MKTKTRNSSIAKNLAEKKGKLRPVIKLLAAAATLAMAVLAGASSSTQVEQLAPLAVPRTAHTATVLKDGSILITGGRDAAGTALAVAEIFDPKTRTSKAIGDLVTARAGHTATLLKDGRVLIAGGTNATGTLASAEMFEPLAPSSGFSALSAEMGTPRTRHTATLLNDGKVLLAGGDSVGTAELFDPATESFSITLLTMAERRTDHTATLFADNTVLLAGGQTDSMETFSAADQTFTLEPQHMTDVRISHEAIALSDTRLLFFGGDAANTIDEFDFSTDTLALKATMDAPASSATLLANGNILVLRRDVAGIYAPEAADANSAFTAFDELAMPGSRILARRGQTATQLPEDKRILVAGGVNADNDLVGPVAVFNPARIWTDKDDYYPEEIVLLNGSGWKPNEEIYLFVVDSATEQWTYKSTERADANGNFAVNPYFIVEQRHLGVTFNLTAYGAVSTMQANVTFTDANRQLNIGSFSITAPSGATDNTMNVSQPFTVRLTYNSQQNVTWTNVTATLTVPAGWSKSADLSQPTLTGTANQTFDWTVTPSATAGSGSISVSLTGTPPAGDSCNQCPFTSNITGVNSVNPAALTTTSMTAAKTVGGGTTAKSGDSITVNLTAANGAVPRASALTVAGSALTVNSTGTATGTCNATTTTAANIAAAGTRTYTYVCTVTGGTGTLSFTGSANGTDQNTAAAVGTGNSTSNSITVDSTVPTISSVTGPANGTYRAGQNLDFTVNYSENVTVTGTPRIPLTIGASAPNASYLSGSGTSTLVFRYTVQAGDSDSDGIASSSPIALNGGTIQDAATNTAVLTFTPPNTTGVLVDSTAPTAAISYSPTGPVKSGTSLVITATFSEPIADSPVMKMAISGANTLAATNMTKTDSTHYTYTHTVGAGSGTATVALSVGTDVAGNLITSAPTSGATFTVDNTAPTAAITYVPTGPVNAGTSQVITATFNEAIADSPVMKITISGANTLAATNMTKTDSTHYTYTHTVGAGDGTATVALSVGTDVAGNVITSAPTSGATFTVDNTPPAAPTTLDLNNGDDSGVSNMDNITNQTTNLRISGMAPGNTLVELFEGATSLGTDTSNNGGNWSITAAGPFSEGPHTFTAKTKDAAGNYSSPSLGLTVTIDVTKPNVTINQAVGQSDPATAGPINFTVVFNESVDGTFITGDTTITGTSGAVSGTVTGGPTTFNVAVATPPNPGTVIANIAAGVATDIAGNTNNVSTSTDNTVTYNPCTSPSVTTQPVNQTVTYGAANVSFTAAASGTPAPTVQWQVNTGSGFTDIAGATSTTLTINNPTVAMSGNQYQAVFTNSCDPATDTSNAATLTVNKADATFTVTPYDVTYDGNPHTATVTTITGVNGETGATVGTVDVSNTTHTDAGMYSSDSWSFTGTANYNNIAATTITDKIGKADATVVVTPYDVTYNGLPHTAAITSITGVNGETGATVGVVDVSNTTHTNAGTYASDYWFFTGTANYNDIGNTTITDEIDKADATFTVTPYDVTYDGDPHTATVTTVTGVNGETGATVGVVDVSNTTHTNAGTYASDYWFFTGTANYNDIGNTTITDKIAKANAGIVIHNYSGTYDANSHGVTATITGVDAGGAAAGSSFSSAVLTNAPGGTVSWSFTGGTNYNDASGNGNVVIAKANAGIVIHNYSGTYDANPHGVTATITGVDAGGTAVGSSFSSGTLTNAPGGTVSWSFSGGTNYNNDSGNGNVVIAKATAMISVTAYTSANTTYDALPHTATATVTGVDAGGAALGTSLNLSGTTHTNAGTYNSDPWSFSGGTNYNDASGTVNDSIAKANQTITWANPAIITLGTPLSGTQLNATVAGVTGGSAPGALTYTPPAGTVLSVGANQALKVDAAETINYKPASKTVYINVNYSFVGFLQPIDNLPVINSSKAGQTIPVKWQLKDAAGNIISDLSSLAPNGLQSVRINCDGSATADPIEELAAPGSTVFRFDGMQFIFNWQTSKSWVGTCRSMTVTLKDGTVHSAKFTFK